MNIRIVQAAAFTPSVWVNKSTKKPAENPMRYWMGESFLSTLGAGRFAVFLADTRVVGFYVGLRLYKHCGEMLEKGRTKAGDPLKRLKIVCFAGMYEFLRMFVVGRVAGCPEPHSHRLCLLIVRAKVDGRDRRSGIFLIVKTNLDKTVFNIESSINATGQTAVEVLEEIPSVSVDVEGNVSLRGSENVTILVDGRATNLTLDQIPADMIESIEVITNPSARLEPDGMAKTFNVF